MLFPRCTKQEVHERRLTSFAASNVGLDKATTGTHSPEYVTFWGLYGTLHLTTSSALRAQRGNVFGLLPESDSAQSYLTIRIWLTFSKFQPVYVRYMRMIHVYGLNTKWAVFLFAFAPIVISYRSLLLLLSNQQWFLLFSSVAELFVYTRIPFSSSNLIGGPVSVTRVFRVATAFVESSVLLSVPIGIVTFVSVVRVLSALQGSQLYY